MSLYHGVKGLCNYDVDTARGHAAPECCINSACISHTAMSIEVSYYLRSRTSAVLVPSGTCAYVEITVAISAAGTAGEKARGESVSLVATN